MISYGMVWCGVVWYGMVWCGVVWGGVVREITLCTDTAHASMSGICVRLATILREGEEERWRIMIKEEVIEKTIFEYVN